MTTPDENTQPEPVAETAVEATSFEATPVEPATAAGTVPEATPVGVPEYPAPPVAPDAYAAAPVAAATYEPAPQAYAPAPQTYAPPAANPTPSTWMNITAFVTGILGLGIVPIIFGHLGVNQSNKGRADFKWMGIVGLVLGYLTVVAYLILTAVFIGALAANS